jgi:hypothetical protein
MKYWDLDPARRATLRVAWNRPVRWPAYALLAVVASAAGPGLLQRWRAALLRGRRRGNGALSGRGPGGDT